MPCGVWTALSENAKDTTPWIQASTRLLMMGFRTWTAHEECLASLARRLTKDYTFSNGLRIPAGNYISACNEPILRDPNHYPEPERFNGFRHKKRREEAGESHNHRFISTGLDNLPFGDGRHVWYVG